MGLACAADVKALQVALNSAHAERKDVTTSSSPASPKASKSPTRGTSASSLAASPAGSPKKKSLTPDRSVSARRARGSTLEEPLGEETAQPEDEDAFPRDDELPEFEPGVAATRSWRKRRTRKKDSDDESDDSASILV